MKNKPLLFLAALIFILNACKKSGKQAQASYLGTWYLQKEEVTYTKNNIVLKDTVSNYPDKKYYYQFNGNVDSVKLQTPDYNGETFRYAQNGNDLLFYTSWNDDSYSFFYIVKVTDDSLHLEAKYEETDFNSPQDTIATTYNEYLVR